MESEGKLDPAANPRLVEPPASKPRGRFTYTRKIPRSYVPRFIEHINTTTERAITWLLPWNIDDYPGKMRGICEIVRGWKYHSIKHWRDGKRHAPVEALDMLIAALRSRLESGQLVLEALYREREEALNRPGRGGRRPHILKAERDAAKSKDAT
jgi:hypothetical protein